MPQSDIGGSRCSWIELFSKPTPEHSEIEMNIHPRKYWWLHHGVKVTHNILKKVIHTKAKCLIILFYHTSTKTQTTVNVKSYDKPVCQRWSSDELFGFL